MSRGPGNPELYDQYCISFGGKEQRMAWAIDDSEMFQKICDIADAIGAGPGTGFQQLIVSEILNPGDTTSSVGVSSYESGRFTLDVIGLAPGERAEVCLQGTFDGLNYFEFTNGAYKFIKNGTYTITVSPLIASEARAFFKTGGALSTVVVSLGANP